MERHPKLADVDYDQFFINSYGCLCQKRNDNCYFVITNSDGRPWCWEHADCPSDEVIDKILPKVTRIEWE